MMKVFKIVYTLLFGRPGWSFSPSPLDSMNWNQKHQERTDGPEHRKPSHHTRMMKSFLCWHPEREKYTKTSVGRDVMQHQWFCFNLLCSDHLVVAGFVLTPVENLLFDGSSGSCGCGRPLELEVSGNGCPAKWNIFSLPLHEKQVFYQKRRLTQGPLVETWQWCPF